MGEFIIIWEWITYAVRWLHVIAAMAWIGSSFYFVALDLGLRKAPNLPQGAHGEEWQVHGGGFYHIQKYLVAPEEMPEHLTWFKWESYTTWLSGFTMLAMIYWAGANLYLIDPSKANLLPWQAIAISAASLSIGYLIYDQLCKSPLGEKPTVLMVLLFVLLVAMGWGYDHIFTGRAVLLHLGAFTATIMTANVFLVIMPNQRIVVDDLKAGRKPAPKYGKIAKLRSTHNNYLTLPVLFLMLSNHFPLAFGTQYNWVIAALIFLMGVVIRHYFNSIHAQSGDPTWAWLAAVIILILCAWLSENPGEMTSAAEQQSVLTPHEQQFVASADYPAVKDLVMGHCSMCHAAEPGWEGIHRPPKGVRFESDKQIASRAEQIYLQAGRTHAMPPPGAASGGVTLTDGERRLIVKWYRESAASQGILPL